VGNISYFPRGWAGHWILQLALLSTLGLLIYVSIFRFLWVIKITGTIRSVRLERGSGGVLVKRRKVVGVRRRKARKYCQLSPLTRRHGSTPALIRLQVQFSSRDAFMLGDLILGLLKINILISFSTKS
jgi:hypothetical protein